MMRTTRLTWLFDFVRRSIQLALTLMILYLSCSKAHWLLALVMAIPVYLGAFVFVDFLTIPLYLVTPENRAISAVLSAIEGGDFSTALRVLKKHEKWYWQPQCCMKVPTIEICRMHNLCTHAVRAT